MNSFFIAGTDTEVGKTTVAVALLNAFKRMGLHTMGIKPIASGCFIDEDGRLKNDDALQLQQAASIKCSYQELNPLAFLPPIAPHIAANQAGLELTVTGVTNLLKQVLGKREADINIVEGVGGWMVPLNSTELMSDVVLALKLPVILVVGMRLGCLNHAILTAKQIIASQLSFIGWIANCLEEKMLVLEENIATLKQHLPAPCLAVIPYSVAPVELDFAAAAISSRQKLESC